MACDTWAQIVVLLSLFVLTASSNAEKWYCPTGYCVQRKKAGWTSASYECSPNPRPILFDLRLTSYPTGILEIYFAEAWRPVCSVGGFKDEISFNQACQQMGYKNGTGVHTKIQKDAVRVGGCFEGEKIGYCTRVGGSNQIGGAAGYSTCSDPNKWHHKHECCQAKSLPGTNLDKLGAGMMLSCTGQRSYTAPVQPAAGGAKAVKTWSSSQGAAALENIKKEGYDTSAPVSCLKSSARYEFTSFSVMVLSKYPTAKLKLMSLHFQTVLGANISLGNYSLPTDASGEFTWEAPLSADRRQLATLEELHCKPSTARKLTPAVEKLIDEMAPDQSSRTALRLALPHINVDADYLITGDPCVETTTSTTVTTTSTTTVTTEMMIASHTVRLSLSFAFILLNAITTLVDS